MRDHNRHHNEGEGKMTSEKLFVLAVSVVALASFSLLAEESAHHSMPGVFERSPENPVKTDKGVLYNPQGDPAVLFEDGIYKFWFTYVVRPYTETQVMGTAYAESKDGIVWDVMKDETGEVKLVLEPDKSGWDGEGVETVSVVRAPDGEYRLYYTGDLTGATLSYSIGLATSKDGKTWTKHGKRPVLEPQHAWESAIGDEGKKIGGVLEPTVLYDAEEEEYRMWYAALGTKEERFAFRLGYATSNDGITWERRLEPVYEPGPEGAWDANTVSHCNVVRDPQHGYHLFYHGISADGDKKTAAVGGSCFTPGQIGHAYSEDGIQWQRNPANPILGLRPDSWESWFLGGPAALIRDGKFMLWYFGTDQEKRCDTYMGLATAEARPK